MADVPSNDSRQIDGGLSVCSKCVSTTGFFITYHYAALRICRLKRLVLSVKYCEDELIIVNAKLRNRFFSSNIGISTAVVSHYISVYENDQQCE